MPSPPTKPSASERASTFSCSIRALLYSAGTRFVLAGIVNRMDRAYVSPESCGEVRLIYRLTRGAPAGEDGALAAAADDAERRAEGEGRER